MEVILVLSLFVNTYFIRNELCKEEKTEIVEVGPCNFLGTCAVVFKNGDRGYSEMPIKGSPVIYRKCKK